MVGQSSCERRGRFLKVIKPQIPSQCTHLEKKAIPQCKKTTNLNHIARTHVSISLLIAYKVLTTKVNSKTFGRFKFLVTFVASIVVKSLVVVKRGIPCELHVTAST